MKDDGMNRADTLRVCLSVLDAVKWWKRRIDRDVSQLQSLHPQPTVAVMTSSHCLVNQSLTPTRPRWPIDRRVDWCKRGGRQDVGEDQLEDRSTCFSVTKAPLIPLARSRSRQNAHSAPRRLRKPHSFVSAYKLKTLTGSRTWEGACFLTTWSEQDCAHLFGA